MLIKTIREYDEEAKEADVVVSDGQHEILCYAQPFENNNTSFVLLAFDDDNIMRALKNTYVVEKSKEDHYGYKLQGKLVDLKKRLVAIGDIVIELGNGIPKDIKENEFIEFTVVRVDLIEN